MFTRRNVFNWLATFLVTAALLVGCENKETDEVIILPPPSLLISTSVHPTDFTPGQPTSLPTIKPTPTKIFFGSFLESDLDIRANPVETPLELQIPTLKVNAPVVSVGLTKENIMAAPKGEIDDPIWHSAFWYRGSGFPGDVGVSTIAGHLSDSLGRPEIFANLEDLEPGDLIIIRVIDSNLEIHFTVDQTVIYSVQESSDPAVLAKIYGEGPLSGRGPMPSSDGLSHLTLLTCTGGIANGHFDHHVVVYATRVN
ncbi:MAG: class F sortase [Anaerolineaceae bacterium]|nr:class F sortase [Anaerolineaceae bacterium]